MNFLNSCLSVKGLALLLVSILGNRVLAQKEMPPFGAVQDTLTMGLSQIEQRFIDSNFLLLASHYHVEATRAMEAQAGLWQNPVLNTEFMLGANGRYLQYHRLHDGSYFGQYYIQIQQLIQTAGKRHLLIMLAKSDTRTSELELNNLIRNLRYQLHQDYYTLCWQFSTLKLYRQQAAQLVVLLGGMEEEFKHGDVAEKDLLRVQALKYSLDQDINDLNKSMVDTQADLKTLLKIDEPNAVVVPIDELQWPAIKLPDGNLSALFGQAQQFNPEYQLQKEAIHDQELQVAYQKALKVPDITIGPDFDRNSNFAPNYLGLSLSVPLPLWNKNRGAVKQAEFELKNQQITAREVENELYNHISGSYEKLLLSISLKTPRLTQFYVDYSKIFNAMMDSYKLRKISLLEFLDFFNDYTAARQRFLKQILDLNMAQEDLHYYLGR